MIKYGKYRWKLGNYERKIIWIVKRYRKWGRKVGWIVKWYGKYGKKVSWIVKRHGQYGKKDKLNSENIFGKYRKKLWKDMEYMNTMWNDMKIWKKRKLNREKIWKLWMKKKIKCEKILKYGRKVSWKVKDMEIMEEK